MTGRIRSGMTIMLAIAALTAFAAAASAAPAADRKPLHLQGLAPDGWGQDITNAEQSLRSRYPGIARDYCVGIVIDGYAPRSSSVNGLARYWDKLACFGMTSGGATFGLVYDQKSRTSWIIYRLAGVSSLALGGR